MPGYAEKPAPDAEGHLTWTVLHGNLRWGPGLPLTGYRPELSAAEARGGGHGRWQDGILCPRPTEGAGCSHSPGSVPGMRWKLVFCPTQVFAPYLLNK